MKCFWKIVTRQWSMPIPKTSGLSNELYTEEKSVAVYLIDRHTLEEALQVLRRTTNDEVKSVERLTCTILYG